MDWKTRSNSENEFWTVELAFAPGWWKTYFILWTFSFSVYPIFNSNKNSEHDQAKYVWIQPKGELINLKEMSLQFEMAEVKFDFKTSIHLYPKWKFSQQNWKIYIQLAESANERSEKGGQCPEFFFFKDCATLLQIEEGIRKPAETWSCCGDIECLAVQYLHRVWLYCVLKTNKRADILTT